MVAKRKLDHRLFQENWTKEYEFLEQKDCAVCFLL